MRVLLKVERFFDLLMSFASIVGFASTAYLVWIFLHTPPTVQVGTSNLGVSGLSVAQTSTIVIQGVPFFWVFTSLISLSAGHTYRAGQASDPVFGREELLPSRSTSHAHSADSGTDPSKTKTDRNQSVKTGSPLARKLH